MNFLFKQKKRKKNTNKKNYKEGRELTFFLLLLHLGWSSPLAFSSCFFLSTFLQCWVFHFLWSLCCEALCYSSSKAVVSSRDGVTRTWGEGGRRGGRVGRRGKFWGREWGWKIPRQGKRVCFWFIPKIAWTTSSSSGCWFTLTHYRTLRKKPLTNPIS